MKLITTLLIATLSVSAHSATHTGYDQNNEKCSIEIIKKTPSKIIAKLRGVNLNKKVKLNFLESHSSYYASNDKDYGTVLGLDLGSVQYTQIRFEQKTFTYYDSGFLLSKEIDVNCDFQD